MSETAILGIAGVVGTLLGALVGAGGTFLIERSRRRHEDRTRWVPERKALYERVLATWVGTLSDGLVEDRSVGYDRMSLELMALAPAMSILSGRRAMEVYMDLMSITGAGAEADPGTVRLVAHQEAFAEVARKELGIPD